MPKIYVISDEEVRSSLSGRSSSCLKIIDCPLLPGDILLRNYPTNRTRLYEAIFNPYFTHSAIYYGDGLVIEALGDDPDDSREIQIRGINETDWLNEDMVEWVVIRIKSDKEVIDRMREKAKEIAEDDTQIFGLGKNKHTCSGLIAERLIEEGLVVSEKDEISPDRLFRYAIDHGNAFEIVAFKNN
ncbi:MAG: hypothetical protein PHW52_01055 [Candidatus Pacebacteria bacterium]|nr:hypothetical protein [Candidatus Paceibacterota bacterium]